MVQLGSSLTVRPTAIGFWVRFMALELTSRVLKRDDLTWLHHRIL